MSEQAAVPAPDEYDSPWKEALERYFPPFMEFFFPQAYQEIDWSRGYEFLDKELQRVVRSAAVGRRYVDKLARVWRRSGAEAWVLVHIEVQGHAEAGFPERLEEELIRFAEEEQMPYVTSGERFGYQKAILEFLVARFEVVPEAIRQDVERVWDPASLSTLIRQAATVRSLEEFQHAVAAAQLQEQPSS
jgi:hypothetical protein